MVNNFMWLGFSLSLYPNHIDNANLKQNVLKSK